MIKKDFLKSSLIYTLSSVLPVAASFLLLPFYTNTGLLSVSDYGALILYIGISLLVQVIAGFSLEHYVVVAYHELKNIPEELKKKISSLNGYLLTIGGITVLLIAMGAYVLPGLLQILPASAITSYLQPYTQNTNPESYKYLLMSVCTGFLNAHFKFYNNLLIQREKPWVYLGGNILNFLSTIAFSLLILFLFPNTLEGPMWGRLLSGVCVFALSFGNITYAYGLSFRKEFIKPAWYFCFPLMLTAIFQWTLSYSDRYIIKPLLYNAEVGIFDLAVKSTMLISFAMDGLSGAISPKVFSLLREEKNSATAKEMNKLFSGLNAATLILIPLNILFIPIFLPVFLSNEKYYEAFLYMGIVSASYITRGLQDRYIFSIYHHRKTSRLITINGVAAVLQVLVGYFMVKYFQLYGAAFTLIFIKIVLVALYAYNCRDIQAIPVNAKKMIWLPLGVLVIISLAELLVTRDVLRMHVVHAVEFSFIVGLVYFVYKQEVLDLVNWIITLLKKRISPSRNP